MTYTPSTEEIRTRYLAGYLDSLDAWIASKEFNRWLAEYTRQQREEAWNHARSEVRMIPSWFNPETREGGFDLQPLGPDDSSEEGAWMAVMEILDDNPYRQDEVR